MDDRERYFNEVDLVYNRLVDAVKDECNESNATMKRPNLNPVLRFHNYKPVTQTLAKHIINKPSFQLTQKRDGIVIFEPHTDFGYFNILAYSGNNSSGLECEENGQFNGLNVNEYVKPGESAVLVFVGKALEFVSKFKAPLHRVVALPEKQNSQR